LNGAPALLLDDELLAPVRGNIGVLRIGLESANATPAASTSADAIIMAFMIVPL
jgi:hypothetical protein